MGLVFAGRGPAVAPVTSGTAKLVRIVKLKQFAIRVTGKRLCQRVGLLGSDRHHVLRFDLERLARPQVADFAAIDDVVFGYVYLLAQDRVIKFFLPVDQSLN